MSQSEAYVLLPNQESSLLMPSLLTIRWTSLCDRGSSALVTDAVVLMVDGHHIIAVSTPPLKDGDWQEPGIHTLKQLISHMGFEPRQTWDASAKQAGPGLAFHFTSLLSSMGRIKTHKGQLLKELRVHSETTGSCYHPFEHRRWQSRENWVSLRVRRRHWEPEQSSGGWPFLQSKGPWAGWWDYHRAAPLGPVLVWHNSTDYKYLITIRNSHLCLFAKDSTSPGCLHPHKQLWGHYLLPAHCWL